MRVLSLILLLSAFLACPADAQEFKIVESPTFVIKPGPVVTRATYAIMSQRAASEGKLLVVFVGYEARPIKGALVYSHWEPEPVLNGPIVVSRPKYNQKTTAYSLPISATEAEILRLGDLLTPRPFLKRLQLRKSVLGLQTVDDDGIAGGPWPDDVPFTDGLVLYKPAEWTQSIATTDNRPSITKVNRLNLPSKWHQPGGMEGLTGWRSDLYKHVPPGYVGSWTQRLPVLNRYGNFQYELGWTRSYPDGTEFHDVLSTDKGVFEHRVRRKDLAWSSVVVYRNRAAYPAGYVGLRGVQCASCHNEAGTGAYGVGMIPGGDTVLSDPISALERQ